MAARFLDACFAKSADGLRSFLGGLYDVVQPEALMLLSARELELQLCGAPTIDVKAWKRSCVYRGDFDVQKGNPFAPLHPVVQFFWDEVESWSDEQRALLLLWCTVRRHVMEGRSAPACAFRGCMALIFTNLRPRSCAQRLVRALNPGVSNTDFRLRRNLRRLGLGPRNR